jgi:NAD-dependent SIR2 family protein deacetylase
VVVGAGISVSAGIPDFRSPKTGLYDSVKPMLKELLQGYRGSVKDFASMNEIHFGGKIGDEEVGDSEGGAGDGWKARSSSSSSSSNQARSTSFSPPRRRSPYNKKKHGAVDDIDPTLLFNVDMFSKFPQLFTRFMNSSANEGFGQECLTSVQPTVTHQFLKFLQDQKVMQNDMTLSIEN